MQSYNLLKHSKKKCFKFIKTWTKLVWLKIKIMNNICLVFLLLLLVLPWRKNDKLQISQKIEECINSLITHHICINLVFKKVSLRPNQFAIDNLALRRILDISFVAIFVKYYETRYSYLQILGKYKTDTLKTFELFQYFNKA